MIFGACGGNDSESPTEPQPSEPSTGAVSVQANTTGDTLDQDGYTVTLDGTDESLGVDGSVLYSGLDEGDHTAELSGLQKNCTPGSSTQSVTVTAGDTTSMSFDVSCEAALFDRIVFVSNRGGDANLYVMNTDGSGQTQLTSDTITDIPHDVSPDGTRILVETDRNGNTEIYSMAVDGSDVTRLTTDPASDDYAEWSPDGSMIVFASRRDGNEEIYTMNADGTGKNRVTADTARDDFPSWAIGTCIRRIPTVAGSLG